MEEESEKFFNTCWSCLKISTKNFLFHLVCFKNLKKIKLRHFSLKKGFLIR